MSHKFLKLKSGVPFLSYSQKSILKSIYKYREKIRVSDGEMYSTIFAELQKIM